MATNDFLPFAGGTGANVLSQAAYNSLQARVTGFQTGICQSAQINKILRQPSLIAAMIAQFICDETNANAVDDGTIATLETNFIAAVQQVALASRLVWSQSLWTDTGSTNALAVTLTPVPTGLAQLVGIPLQVRVANSTTTAATLNVNGLGATNIAQPQASIAGVQPALEPGAMHGSGVFVLVFDGVNFQLISRGSIQYSFDVSTAPPAGQLLLPGDKAVITWAGLTSIPFHINTAPGLYRMRLAFTTVDANIWLFPNDVAHVNSCSSWWIVPGYDGLSGVGTVTRQASVVGIDIAPFISNFPFAWWYENNIQAFLIDCFAGPGPRVQDTTHDTGSTLHDYIISTYTAAKFMRHQSGVAGGSGIGFSQWNDTTTAWTSLGTLSDNSTSVKSGTAVIERLA